MNNYNINDYIKDCNELVFLVRVYRFYKSTNNDTFIVPLVHKKIKILKDNIERYNNHEISIDGI